jgi:Zn-dependent protease
MNPESVIQPAAAAADHPLPADGRATRAPRREQLAAVASKIMITGGSMALSATLYALLFGWPIAIGLVGLLFIHEMGHWLACRQKCVQCSVPLFIPFLGAFINMPKRPKNAATMAYIALAGPVVGSLGAFACQLIGLYYHSHLFIVLAFIGYLINMLNMVPYGLLDGGQAIAAISPKLWPIGLLMLAAWGYLTHSYLVLAVIVVFLPDMIMAFRNKRSDSYYCVPRRTRLICAGAIVVITGCLAFALSTLATIHWLGH